MILQQNFPNCQNEFNQKQLQFSFLFHFPQPSSLLCMCRKFFQNALVSSHPTKRRWPAATSQTHLLPFSPYLSPIPSRTGYLIRYVNPEQPKVP